jgi:hypothetical protein
MGWKSNVKRQKELSLRTFIHVIGVKLWFKVENKFEVESHAKNELCVDCTIESKIVSWKMCWFDNDYNCELTITDSKLCM